MNACLQVIQSIDRPDSPYSHALQTLRDKIKAALDDDQRLQRAAVEYSKLFLLPGGVVPYASYHLSDKNLIKQGPWEAVYRYYIKRGWRLDESSEPLADHVSVELAFMGKLIQEGDAESQQDFFNDHVSPWVTDFLYEVASHAGSDLYRTVACYGQTFLADEKNRLSFKG